MSLFTASLSAAEAYIALQSSFDTPDIDLSGELMDRVVAAPIRDRADADAKARLLAAIAADVSSDQRSLERQLATWAVGSTRPIGCGSNSPGTALHPN
jgi:hypothetical protein